MYASLTSAWYIVYKNLYVQLSVMKGLVQTLETVLLFQV